ncbi:MAG: hypothetical protein JSU64_07315 [candidate division WOR-3 bacterium]|nr:MAG: hypothetical protein JSU64_07315 [candidate division WOR-3 bacterium]
MILLFFFLVGQSQIPGEAIGISDKGELSNVTTNFGLISYHHYITPACHWPNAAPFPQQYCVGFGFFAAQNYNVVESFDDIAPEWLPIEGSYGGLYSGIVVDPTGTPIMATSDEVETWPIVDGEPAWPGPFRKDTLGQPVPGEFTSDRDLFSIYNDRGAFGLQVNQSVYSYGRTYAEDFIFFDLNIYNTADTAVDSIYLGFRSKFRCDYDMKDYIGLYRDSVVTFIYYWDADGIPEPNWTSVGMIGVGFLNQTIDNFHYWEKEDRLPEDSLFDNLYFPLIVSNPDDPLIDTIAYRFFHGDDIHIDDPSIIQALPIDSVGTYDFIVSSGPKNITPDDTVQFSFVIVCGEDSADLFDNLQTALLMADNYFLGSDPPAAPIVSAASDYRKITLFWDPEPSESSSDILTGKQDFEGYKIYRSDDQGVTWGTEITNDKGHVVGYVPLAQYDLVDGIEGIDPAFPYQSLGRETGLKHTFVDTMVYNGIEYWYCVAAYDQGNQHPDSLEPSYQNAKGRPSASHVVAATAAPMPSGYVYPYIQGGDTLAPIGGPCDGTVVVQVVDPAAVSGHTYRITFEIDSVYHPAETTWVDTTTFTLFDVTDQETLLTNNEISDNSLDNIPVVDGLRLLILNSENTVSMGWTSTVGAPSTFQWWVWTENYSTMVGPTYIYGRPNFRVVVDRSANSIFHVEDGFGGDTLSIQMPLRVYDITDEANPVDVSEHCWLLDYAYSDVFPPQTESLYFGPEGWDLIPGGAGYNNSPNGPLVGFFDQLGLWNGDLYTATAVVYFGTQNGDSTALAPSDGDEFTVKLLTPISDTISYEFTTVPYAIDQMRIRLDSIGVVPNPYILASKFESTPYDRRLMFTKLPEQCEILIYNVAGEHIATIEHNNNLGYEYWDLRTKYGVEIAYGMYIYVIRTESGAKANGKFVIIK